MTKTENLTKLTNENKLELILEQEKIISEQNLLIEELTKSKHNVNSQIEERKDDSLKAVLSFVMTIYSFLEKENLKVNEKLDSFIKSVLSDIFNLTYNALQNAKRDIPSFYQEFVKAGEVILLKLNQ